MKEKQVFAVMAGERLITTVEAKDSYRAMQEFKVLMRNTWALSDPKALRIVPITT